MSGPGKAVIGMVQGGEDPEVSLQDTEAEGSAELRARLVGAFLPNPEFGFLPRVSPQIQPKIMFVSRPLSFAAFKCLQIVLGMALVLAGPLQAQDMAVKMGLDPIDQQYELRLIPNATEADLPQTGSSLLVIAQMEGGALYFRLFNSTGLMMADLRESQLIFNNSAVRPVLLSELKATLGNPLLDASTLSTDQRYWIIRNSRHILGLQTTPELRPTIESSLQTVDNLRGLSGLLAGFMIAVVFSLVQQPRRPIVAWTLFMTASSAAGFIVSAFICTFVMIIGNNVINNMVSGLSAPDYYASGIAWALQSWAGMTLIFTLLSSLPFAGAIGLSGWIYSRVMGLLTILIGLISLGFMAGSVAHVVWTLNR